MKVTRLSRFTAAALISVLSNAAMAHDPIFGVGPHVLFKEGVELALEVAAEQAGDEKEQALAFELAYGLTADWAMGVDLPYLFKEEGVNKSQGQGDIAFFTKYRFWREDSMGLQESAAVLLKVITDTASNQQTPTLNKGVTDTIIGLTYGYEGRKWYRWASVRYRNNGTNEAGVDRGDKVLLDFVVAIRPTPSGYLQPDTVWILELNGEFGKRAKLAGTELANSGGEEWFVSPGVFWTKRNFAIKAGVQIPIIKNLNGNQEASDYRAKITFEWHI